MLSPRVSIQTGDFNLADEIAALRAGDKRVGAVCSFLGTVRDRNMASTLRTGVSSLPPAGAELARGGPSLGTDSPTLRTGVSLLPPAGAELARGGPSLRSTAVQDEVHSMELEHYPGMTEKAIEAMIDEAHKRFDIYGARVIHRVGLLQPLDQIVLVAVSSAHRGESFQACEFLMDYLKTQAPVDARVSDDAALARWGIQSSNG